jgi:ABC-type sugar transport system ATPase subunit
MQMKAFVARQPRLDLGMFVGGVIIADEMQIEILRRVAVDGAQEAQESLMPMPVHAFADDLAAGHVERGEQRGGSMPLVVVRLTGHRPPVGQAEGVVELVEPAGSDAYVIISAGGKKIIAPMRGDADAQAGQRIAFAFNLAKAMLFDPKNGNRLA